MRPLHLAFAFTLAVIPVVRSQEPVPRVAEKGTALYPGALRLEYSVLEGELVVANSIHHGEIQDHDGYRDSEGTVMLRFTDGQVWTIENTLMLWSSADGQPGRFRDSLKVSIYDLKHIGVPRGESNSVLPVEVFNGTRSYRGPGTYLLFEEGERRVTVTVYTGAAVEAKPTR